MRLSFSTVLWFCLIVVILVPVALVIGWGQWTPEHPGTAGWNIRVYLGAQGIVTMPLEEYVKGVVAAEVPASFEPEALKAQAVAARTYAAREIVALGGKGCELHPGADACTDPGHCQAYFSVSELRSRWGLFNYFRYWRRVSAAVDATAGRVLTYDGQLIDAVYHSTSGGPTENSEDVWGTYVPYLRSVACNWDQDSPRYTETRRVLASAVERELGVKLPRGSVTTGGGRGLPILGRRPLTAQALRVTSLTSTGRVREVVIGGKTFTGTELRKALNLRSTRMKFSVTGDEIEITTVGNGHGVGMCQYGANGLAKAGHKFDDILMHYYTGVRLDRLPSPAAPATGT